MNIKTLIFCVSCKVTMTSYLSSVTATCHLAEAAVFCRETGFFGIVFQRTQLK